MALVGISKFETEDYVSQYDPARIMFPDFLDDAETQPHPQAGKLNIEASREAGATIFKIGALTVDERAYITDKTGVIQRWNEQGEAELVQRNGMRNLEACRLGIKGWENFRDPDGNDIKFVTVKKNINGDPRDVLNDAGLRSLGTALITELGERVLNRNAFLEAVRKNLNGPVQPSVSSPDTTA